MASITKSSKLHMQIVTDCEWHERVEFFEIDEQPDLIAIKYSNQFTTNQIAIVHFERLRYFNSHEYFFFCLVIVNGSIEYFSSHVILVIYPFSVCH